jgi:serine/threonine protein kinase
MSGGFEDDLDPTETITLDLAATLRALRRDGSLERRFDLTEELGRGGMGTVRLGTDKHLGRTVAVKVMHESLADSAPLVSRFLLEAQLAGQLEHPNILPLYTLERDALDRPALAMKLIQGQTYHDYLWICAREAQKNAADDGPYALPARIEPLIKVCEALAYAHKRGVIHRDVKPANVMLAEDGQVFLMDWGLARVQNDPRVEVMVDLTAQGRVEAHHTRPGQVIGTPAYMSPEQARAENTTLTGAADQFSMGLTLYEAVTLRVARSASDDAVARRQARDALVPRPTHRFGHQIPPRLVAVIQKATMPRVEDRYPSMAHLAEDLRRVFTDGPLLAVQEPLGLRVRRALLDHPTRVLAVLTAVTTSAALGALLAVGSATDTERRHGEAIDQLARVQTTARTGAHALEAPLAAVTRLLESTAGAASALRAHGEYSGVRRPLAEGYYKSDEYPFTWSDDYRHRLTWDRPTYYLAPGAAADAQARLLQLSPLDELLPAELARAVRSSTRTGALGQATHAVHRVYVTFVDGLMVHYPGFGEVTQGYDPRTRPAFQAAARTHGRRFRAPFVDWDTARVLLPCTTALYAEGGTFVGVAGVDVSLAALVAALPLPTDGGWSHVWLLDAEARVLAGADSDGRGFEATATAELPLVPSTTLRARVALRENNGLFEQDDALWAFHRAGLVGWYYVVVTPNALTTR